ncbi:hypothetical protein BH11ACT8_BH11ACT8_08190 [soil metagenome]
MKPGLVEKLNALDSQTLGSRLKAARLAAGLTQPVLGREDASITLISRIESGQRRPNPALLDLLCERLGVAAEEIVLGYPAVEDRRRLELALDFAELQLVGGSAEQALTEVEAVLAGEPAWHGLEQRARFVRASALDSLGDPGAVAGYQQLLTAQPADSSSPVDMSLRLRAATALCRILRESGDLHAAIDVATKALDHLAAESLDGAEEAIRLTVTLASALFEAGDVQKATTLCRDAIVEADRLKSPMARGAAYWNASIIEAEAGQLDRALDLARRALELFEGGDDTANLGRLRTQLSSLLLQEDPPLVQEALDQLGLAERELSWSGSSSADSARHDLVSARACFLAGDAEGARRHAELTLAGAQSMPLVAVSALTLLGQMAWAQRDVVGAREQYVRGIQVLTGIGSDREAGQLWFDLGGLLDEVELPDQAREAYKRAAACLGLAQRSLMPRTTVVRT